MYYIYYLNIVYKYYKLYNLNCKNYITHNYIINIESQNKIFYFKILFLNKPVNKLFEFTLQLKTFFSINLIFKYHKKLSTLLHTYYCKIENSFFIFFFGKSD